MQWFTGLYFVLIVSAGWVYPFNNPNLVAVYDAQAKCVFLKWQNIDPGKSGYLLQRSHDNRLWVDINYAAAEENRKNKLISFLDFRFHHDVTYYRLQINQSGMVRYSETVSIQIGTGNGNWIMYPVPVGSIINLQYKGSEAIQDVIAVFIMNRNGYVLSRKRYSSLTRQIQLPADNLGKGVYEIYIMINEKIVWKQGFIK